jgi:hypothetical protein
VRFRPLEGVALQFLALAIGAATAVQLARKPTLRELAATAAISLAAYFQCMRLGSHGAKLAPAPVIAISSLGIATIIVLGAKAIASTDHLKPFLLAAFCPLLVVFTSVTLAIAIPFQPVVYDLYLYRFDTSLGFQPSFALGRLFLAAPALRILAFAVYASLPFALVLLFLITECGTSFRRRSAIKAVLLGGVIGFAFYQLCPSVGPIYVFAQRFPHQPPAQMPVSITRVGDFPRNAMPSLHVMWALLLWWNLRSLPRLRHAAIIYLWITILATMGFGEHYAIDVIVAVPVAILMQAWAVGDRRIAFAAAGLALTWIGYLRFLLASFVLSAPFGWLPVGASIALSFRMAWLLANFEGRVESPPAPGFFPNSGYDLQPQRLQPQEDGSYAEVR